MQTAPSLPSPPGIPVAAGGAVSYPRVASHRVSLLILLALVALMAAVAIGATRHNAVRSSGASATSAVIATAAGATPPPLANGNPTPTVAPPLSVLQVVPAAQPQAPVVLPQPQPLAVWGNPAPRPSPPVIMPRGGDDDGGDD